MSGLGNGGIRFDLNYSVINETKQNKQLARAKVRRSDTICFLSEIFVYALVNKYNYLVKKCLNFPDFFKTKWNETNSSLSFTINNEQIEPNLNGVFANKYDKIQC